MQVFRCTRILRDEQTLAVSKHRSDGGKRSRFDIVVRIALFAYRELALPQGPIGGKPTRPVAYIACQHLSVRVFETVMTRTPRPAAGVGKCGDTRGERRRRQDFQCSEFAGETFCDLLIDIAVDHPKQRRQRDCQHDDLQQCVAQRQPDRRGSRKLPKSRQTRAHRSSPSR